MADLGALFDDLREEQGALDAMVADQPAPRWLTPTPSQGWDVADSVSHLCFFDEAATLALDDPEAFGLAADGIMRGRDGADDLVPGRTLTASELLARWRTARAALRAALSRADPRVRVPWFGPPMGVASFATARLMETWAHGQDVADALGLPSVVSPRLRHVCHIGVGARPYALQVNSLPAPTVPIRVEATAPDGSVWTWGPADAADRVAGTALDVALVLTRRRHPADTAITVLGPAAIEWIAIAQSFAGRPGPIRPPAAPVAPVGGSDARTSGG